MQNRVNTSTDTLTGLTTTNHYSSPSDSPSWTVDSASSWSRSLTGIGGGLVAQDTSSANTYQLASLHGDIMATTLAGGSAPATTSTYAEFGAVETGPNNTYGYLGTQQRSSNALGGQMIMGARGYNTNTGRFDQTDPMSGGNATAYTYPSNPITSVDPSGNYGYYFSFPIGWYWSTSAQDINGFVVTHFNWAFPLWGCPNVLRVGIVCYLLSFAPIRVIGIGSTWFRFYSLPGHPEGANKTITFSFSEDWWGFASLNVVAYGPDNTACERNVLCTFANRQAAFALWGAFAAKTAASLKMFGYW